MIERGMQSRIAVGQMRSGTDVIANRASMIDLVQRASSAGADLLALPEYATYLGSDTRYHEVGEPIPDGPTVTMLRQQAAAHGLAILLGSMVEKGSDGSLHNTSVFVDAGGEVISTYRKVHLFTSTLPGAAATEANHITAGTEVTTTSWRGWRVGLSICFDVRFPELYRELAAEGAEIITVPAAFVAVTGKDHWEVLLRARAIENQAFVVAPAQIGPYEGGGQCFGRSCIVDPWGTVLAVVGDGEGTGIAIAEIDYSRLLEVRTTLPALENRRFGRAALGSIHSQPQADRSS